MASGIHRDIAFTLADDASRRDAPARGQEGGGLQHE
jgi:hypothetical protein